MSYDCMSNNKTTQISSTILRQFDIKLVTVNRFPYTFYTENIFNRENQRNGFKCEQKQALLGATNGLCVQQSKSIGLNTLNSYNNTSFAI